MSFPWLTVTAAIPLVGAILVAFIPRAAGEADQAARDDLAKWGALAFSLLALAATVGMLIAFAPGGPGYQFTQTYSWIPQFGIHYAVGVDGIALVLIAMTTILMPVVVLASWHDADRLVPAAAAGDGGAAANGTAANGAAATSAAAAVPRRGRTVKAYFAWMLLLEAMLVLLFSATDVFLFYVLFEAMLIPMYFMIGSYGVGKRQYAAVKFLLYSLLGGLLMLAAVIALYVYSAQNGHHGSFLLSQLTHVALSPGAQKWLFLGFFIAFAIKAPLWPFHTWLPDAAAAAQPGGAVLLVGVMDKVGTFGMIRYCLLLFPSAAHYFTPLVIVLAVVGVLYGAIVAIGQRDMKRLIAYTSVSHFGLIVLGIFVFTSQGQTGATLYMVNHGFATGALFLVAGFMIARRRSHMIADYGGVQKIAPLLAGAFLISGLAGLSLPGLNTFVSEFLVLVGTFTRYKAAAVAATIAIILAAIYILWWYQRTMTGPVRAGLEKFPDLKARELWAVGPLIALIIALGVYPQPVLNIINPAVHRTLVSVHSTDPVPPHPATVSSVTSGASMKGTTP